ncbi:hypothetical protein O6H91_04G066200 [Diphasiastrum complanatum]|uniref:Uncharacterized protein n=2 Tax=Diphasiastrum complanatum TaxID=34168 RepID=A0ACC2DXP4_DIPCM|nr:hypothetical protein O6H91_04G066200 [Diphasiastrum complanatum]KAJ7559020.1 hypothetical protein O6H91_04G066200 [Diphasiastrum complanatum]
MGCVTSKIENEEVIRCKNRKIYMQQAVSSRHSFAAAHAAYIYALKNVAAGFRGFAETQEFEPQTLEPAPKQLWPPPPPPLPPPYLPPPSPPGENIIRSMSMPPLMLQKQASSPPKAKQINFPDSPKQVTKQEKEEFVYGEVKLPPSPPPLSSPPLPASSIPPPPVNHSTWDIEYLNPFRVDPIMHVQEPRKMHQTLETVGEQQESTYGREVESEESESEESDELDVEQQQQEQEKQHEAEVLDQVIYEPKKTTMLEEAQPKENFVDIPNKERAIVMTTPKVGKDLADVLREVDGYFLTAYEIGKDVTVMLEARKIHYHSNFVDTKGYYDHSSKVLNAISWGYADNNKPPLASREETEEYEEHQTQETHASTLDKLFAWEKKLYDEVKGAESIQIEYDRKYAALQHQENKSDEPEGLEKLRATVKTLHTRVAVAVQAVKTASLAINRLRDEELFPQLLELIRGLRQMWEKMCNCHQQQMNIAMQLKRLDNLKHVQATTSLQMLATEQLESTLYAWQDTLNKVIATQKIYTQKLNEWLELSRIPLEILSKNNLDSPTNRLPPPIWTLCHEWQKALDGLRVEVAVEAINEFTSTVSQMVQKHVEEKKHRNRAEILSRELKKKENALRNYEMKYLDYAWPDGKPEVTGNLVVRDPLQEKKNVIEDLQRRLDEENGKIADAIEDSRKMTINILAPSLPRVFQAMTTFSSLCLQAYHGLSKQATIEDFPRLTEN